MTTVLDALTRHGAIVYALQSHDKQVELSEVCVGRAVANYPLVDAARWDAGDRVVIKARDAHSCPGRLAKEIRLQQHLGVNGVRIVRVLASADQRWFAIDSAHNRGQMISFVEKAPER